MVDRGNTQIFLEEMKPKTSETNSGLRSLAMPRTRHANKPAMPTDSQAELARCRGIRRIHLNANVPAREQAPGSQFGPSVHGSLLRAVDKILVGYI